MKITLVTLTLVFVLHNFSKGQTKPSNENKTTPTNYKQSVDDYSAKIDSLIKTTSPRTFNGVILIKQNGETKYSKTYGYSNFENKTPITLNDNFRIQSNSKQITAVLILREVEKGKIDLTNSIGTYLPEIKQTWTDSVTVHQLLNMSSGIVDKSKPLSFRPGTSYYYSNAAYGLLGRIISRVTGKKYTEVANALFKELEMNSTYCYKPTETNPNLISGYVSSNGKLEMVDWVEDEEFWIDFIPSGGIISNVEDLNKWDQKLHNGKILKSKTYESMIAHQILGHSAYFGNEIIGYGYGVRIDDSKKPRVIGHGGRGWGFVSAKFYIPSKDIDVIVLENVFNVDNGIVYYFENKIRELVLNSSLVK